MVKTKNVMRRSLWKSIKSSLGRYIAIVSIIALGAAMFVGLRITRTDMLATGQRFMEKQNMFDLRLLSTVGWSEDSLERIRTIDGIGDAEGVISLDAIVFMEGSNAESVYRFYNIPENINTVELQGGRMPRNGDECLADGYHASDKILGRKVTISTENSDSTQESFAYKTYTIVGYMHTPIYMNMERGSTSLAGGQVSGFLFIPSEGFEIDYYTEIDLTMPERAAAYTKTYDAQVEAFSDYIEPLLDPITADRAEQVRLDAEDAYAEGMEKFLDGQKEFAEKCEEVSRELSDAKQKLEDGQREIDENREKLEDGKKQIEEGRKTIQDGLDTLNDSSEALAQAKVDAYGQLSDANAEILRQYKIVVESRRQVEDGILQIDAGLNTINSYLLPLNLAVMAGEMNLSQLESMLSVMDTGIQAAETALTYAKESANPDEEVIARLEARLQELKDSREEMVVKMDETAAEVEEAWQNLTELETQKAELEAQRDELLSTKATLDAAMDQLDIAFREAENGQIEADNQFAAAEAQIQAGRNKLDAAQRLLESQEKELLEGYAALEEGQKEIDQGWIDFENGRIEAQEGILAGRLELEDARVKLQDAREAIDNMGDPTVFLLGRDTNTGYTALDDNSGIVSGVSKVFPVFFLLVAALVCITTMTRMVSEERTQIGTLKAMGYTNGEIISKYLIYSGSAAILGCTLGVLLGCIFFPQILWMAYSIMFNIQKIVVMKMDWQLCLGVAVSYTVVSLCVTWYCCYSELKEAPAELIRPKAPTSGKKILLEYLPFWKHISFLNKVMLRNIFRYRQRLAMMLLGIGGCMALLMTGFGLYDSISGFVDQQFEKITTYDMEVIFGESMDEEAQAAFTEEHGSDIRNIMFFSQKSVTMTCDSGSKEIYLMTVDDTLSDFIDMHRGSTAVEMPGLNEVVISVGAAQAMELSVGDSITTRDTDLNELTLRVSGIYDNHVYNYLIVSPETVAAQQGSAPGKQMAFITIREGLVDSEVSASISDDSNVYNVIVSSSMQNMVNKMMDALNMVIWLVLVCAGLLGAIVLYNLTNINITERIREIATIKVLGFYSVESAAYVFKENLALSAMGAVLGIGLGKMLLTFVMDKIRIDMVWFDTVITFRSILISFVFTMLTAVLVDVVFFPKLEKINMAEALKSVE